MQIKNTDTTVEYMLIIEIRITLGIPIVPNNAIIMLEITAVLLSILPLNAVDIPA